MGSAASAMWHIHFGITIAPWLSAYQERFSAELKYLVLEVWIAHMVALPQECDLAGAAAIVRNLT
jgi:hypothetical protein